MSEGFRGATLGGLVSLLLMPAAHAQTPAPLAPIPVAAPDTPNKCDAPLDEATDPAELRRLGKSYGNKGDEAQARKWLRKAAEAGDLEAMLDLGCDNCAGHAETNDEQVMWLKKAADGGSSRGAMRLALDYSLGRQGLPRDPEQAKFWRERRDVNLLPELKVDEAKYGDGPVRSQMYGYAFQLAKYYRGQHDAPQAVVWYTRAADAGEKQAAAELQQLYERGAPGVPADPVKAKLWDDRWHAMMLAERIVRADHGDTYAMAQLGMAYLDQPTDIVTAPKDEAEGARWLRRSAEAGNADAMAELGKLYAAGRGVPQDAKTAAEWAAKAVAGKPLAYAPVEQLIKTLDSDPQPVMMLLISRRMVIEHRLDEAAFWFLLGTLRGETFFQTHPDHAETLGDMESAAAQDLHDAHVTASDLAPVIERVLAWDASHPNPYSASKAASDKARETLIAQKAKLIAARDKGARP